MTAVTITESTAVLVSEHVGFNVPMDTLQVISETVTAVLN